jgi:glutaredoxin
MGKFVIYSLEYCPYSKKAVDLFANNKDTKIIHISQSEKSNYNEFMKTFPQIYYIKKDDGCLIGGYDDIKKVIDTGKLQFRIEPKKETTITQIKEKLSYLHK